MSCRYGIEGRVLTLVEDKIEVLGDSEANSIADKI